MSGAGWGGRSLGLDSLWSEETVGCWMGLSLRKVWPCEHRITLFFGMLLNDLGCLLGKVRFSQSLPESLAALHVPLGAGPGKGSEDV